MYGQATAKLKQRQSKNATVLNIRESTFKFYHDFAAAILDTLRNPVIFEQLQSNFLISVGDYPKQWLQRKTIIQGLLQVCPITP
jgi:hypothetical protein